MAEGTTARLDTIDVADGAGWEVHSTHEDDVFRKGSATIEVRYSANDNILGAVRRDANGDSDAVESYADHKVDRLRSWLTGRTFDEAHVDVAVTASPNADRSQLYWDFWLQFRDRVATEHPDWKARAGTSRTSPNATLPAGTPRTIFCSAFRPGPLRLELAFVDPNPAVNLARFDALRAKERQLEQALGESVVWDEMAGKNDTRLYVVSPFESVDARDQWPAIMDWLIEMHVRFKRAIQAVGGLDAGK